MLETVIHYASLGLLFLIKAMIVMPISYFVVRAILHPDEFFD